MSHPDGVTCPGAAAGAVGSRLLQSLTPTRTCVRDRVLALYVKCTFHTDSDSSRVPSTWHTHVHAHTWTGHVRAPVSGGHTCSDPCQDPGAGWKGRSWASLGIWGLMWHCACPAIAQRTLPPSAPAASLRPPPCPSALCPPAPESRGGQGESCASRRLSCSGPIRPPPPEPHRRAQGVHEACWHWGDVGRASSSSYKSFGLR